MCCISIFYFSLAIMTIFPLLVIRSAVSVAVFLSFLVNQDPTSWIIFYYVAIGISAIVLFTSRTDLTKAGIMAVCVNCLAIMVYSRIWMEQRMADIHTTDIVTDNCLPFFRYRQTLEWIVEDFTKPLFFLLSLIQRLRLGYLKILSFIVYLTVHALVLLFLVDFIYVAIISNVQRIAMENFFYSLDENSTENYPKGYFFDDILDS